MNIMSRKLAGLGIARLINEFEKLADPGRDGVLGNIRLPAFLIRNEESLVRFSKRLGAKEVSLQSPDWTEFPIVGKIRTQDGRKGPDTNTFKN